MYECFVCMLIHAPCVSDAHESQKRVGFLGLELGIALMWVLEVQPGLQDQQVLFTAKPTLQPSRILLYEQ